MDNTPCDTAEENGNNTDTKDNDNYVVLTNVQMQLIEDQRQELADLKRHVVFLQVCSLEYFITETYYKIPYYRANLMTKRGQ